MKPHWIRYFALLLCCLASALHAAAPAPSASIDRAVIGQGDSLTLSIRVDDTGSFDEPDFSALQRDFDISGINRSSKHVISNGRAQSWTEWQATLIPRRSGQLTIPPIAAAGGYTQPLSVQVNPPDPGAEADAAEPVFMEVKLDRKSVYVQQQLLLTVRIFRSGQLDNMRITEPEFDNASVRKGSETSFRREINGVPYLVHELTYAIFPQQSGELTIPEIVFSATEPLRARSLFDFPGQGRAVRKLSPQLHAQVKPIPKQFTGKVWLPARNLTLEENWSGNPQQVAVGESITRAVTVRADGLQAAQLPTLELPKIAGAKLYNDQPALDDQQDGSGVHGKRVESTALIPGKPGPLTLPEVKLVWWDVDSDSEKVATLPAQALNVVPGAATTATAAPVIAEPQAGQPAAPAAENPAPAAPSAPWWWTASIALLALAWLATLALYWRLRRRLRAAPPTAAVEPAPTPDESAAFRALGAACRGGDAVAARAALLNWARCFYRRAQLRTTDEVARLSGDAALALELRRLDHYLFGASAGDAWSGENLLESVRRLRSAPIQNKTADSGLPPLYPAA